MELKTPDRSSLLRATVRALAVLAFLYFLNAFVQTGYATPVHLVVGAAWLALCYALSRTLGVVTLLALTFAAMVLWGLFLESAPVSDFLPYYVHAARLSSGDLPELFRTKSPPTVAYYAAFHRLLGPTYAANYIASAAAWMGGAAFVYHTVRPFLREEWKAKFICFALALCPTFVVFAPVVSSESVYFLLSAICAWLIARHLAAAGPFPYVYLGMGLVAAALFLTRATGILSIVVCIAVLGAGSAASLRKVEEPDAAPAPGPLRHPLALSSIVIAAFAAVWLAFAYMSWSIGPEFRITASPWGEVSLLFGTNFDFKGRYNTSDLKLAGYLGEDSLTRAQADERAREIALERITRDPAAFARFALSEKVAQLWGSERSLYDWASGGREPGENLDRRVRTLALAGLDGVYRTTLLLFLVMLAWEIRRPSYLLALGVAALFFSLPHLLLEVQPRYHLAMTSLIVVGSTLLVLEFHERRNEWLSMARSKIQAWRTPHR